MFLHTLDVKALYAKYIQHISWTIVPGLNVRGPYAWIAKKLHLRQEQICKHLDLFTNLKSLDLGEMTGE